MLKAYEMDDYVTLWSANSPEEAIASMLEETGVAADPGYVRELTDAELDEVMPAFDEDEQIIPGEFTSVRQMLAEHGDEPGFLAASMG